MTLSEFEVSFGDDENVLELDRGNGCTTLNIRSVMELYILKWCVLC